MTILLHMPAPATAGAALNPTQPAWLICSIHWPWWSRVLR